MPTPAKTTLKEAETVRAAERLTVPEQEPERRSPGQRFSPNQDIRTLSRPIPSNGAPHRVRALLNLQRTIGNRATGQLLQRLAAGPIRPKLNVGPAGDRYEREADAAADRIAAGKPVGRLSRLPASGLRRQSETEEEEPVQAFSGTAPVQRLCPACEEKTQRLEGDEDEEPVRTKDRVGEPTFGSAAAERAMVRSGSGTPLGGDVRRQMEGSFGSDFSDVRVHTGSAAQDANHAINARAFTHGSDIYLGRGESTSDTRLMAHELTHVVQQASTPQGRPSSLNATIQRMLACPPTLAADDPVPSGWKPYQGDSSVFHCGCRGMLEDRAPTTGDLQNECFYDHSGVLVTESHAYAGCRGTPNEYDSRFLLGIPHATVDRGGIVQAGAPAFITSRVHDLTTAISSAIRVVSTAERVAGSVFSALGDAIATGVLTAIATVDPGNWRFQGLPARSIRHLNVMGAILGSTSLAQDPDTVLRNLTRRLDSFSIAGLLDELAQDINQALQASGRSQRVSSASLGELSLLQLVGWLNETGIVQYVRPPGDIAQEQLAAQRRPSEESD